MKGVWKVAIIGGDDPSHDPELRTEVYDEYLGTWHHAPEYDLPGDAEHEDGKFCWESPDGGIVYIEIENAKVLMSNWNGCSIFYLQLSYRSSFYTLMTVLL